MRTDQLRQMSDPYMQGIGHFGDQREGVAPQLLLGREDVIGRVQGEPVSARRTLGKGA